MYSRLYSMMHHMLSALFEMHIIYYDSVLSFEMHIYYLLFFEMHINYILLFEMRTKLFYISSGLVK